MNSHSELDRVRAEYRRRAADSRLGDRYSLFNSANLFALQAREHALLDLLRSECLTTLAGVRALDIGCGTGGELRRLAEYGAHPEDLYGIDLLPDRLAAAKAHLPISSLALGNAGYLPFPNASFDLAAQFTVFSSIIDPSLKRQMAQEMLRVLRPDGLIIWYDFWWNPLNKQTRGIGPAEIRRLFPNCRYRFRRVTLAPPIARAVAPHSWVVAHLLESLPILRSHYLVAIKKAEVYA